MRNPFRRKSNQTIAELESYYATQGTRSRSTGRAWLMALISLIITVLIIAALFFGIRWIYRTVTDNDTSDSTTSGQVDGEGTGTVITDGSSSDPRSSEDIVVGVLNPDSDSESEAGEAGSENNQSSGGVVSNEAASTSRDVAGDTSESSSESTESSLSTTGGGEIPNTGAGESIALLLLATTAVGYLVSRKFQTTK